MPPTHRVDTLGTGCLAREAATARIRGRAGPSLGQRRADLAGWERDHER